MCEPPPQPTGANRSSDPAFRMWAIPSVEPFQELRCRVPRFGRIESCRGYPVQLAHWVRSGQIARWAHLPTQRPRPETRDDDERTRSLHSAAGCHRSYVGLQRRNGAAGRACSRTRQHSARRRIWTRFRRLHDSTVERRHYERDHDLRAKRRFRTGIRRKGRFLLYRADIVNLVSSLRIGALASSGSAGARNFDSRSSTITFVR